MKFPGFSQGQNAVIDSLRSSSKTAYVVICISPSFSKAPHAASCQLLAVFVTFQEPQPKTSGPRDQRTRGTRGPGDQRTRGPEDEGTRAPGAQSRVYGTKGPQDQLASPNSKAQAEPTLEKKKKKKKKKPGTRWVMGSKNRFRLASLTMLEFLCTEFCESNGMSLPLDSQNSSNK